MSNLTTQTLSQTATTTTPIPFFQQKIGLFSALGAIATIFALGIIFSPALAFGLVAAIALAITAFRKPLWLVTGLLWYMPLEPFLLKFIPSDFYLYIRFGSEAVIYLIVIALLWKFISRQLKWQLTAFDMIFAALLGTMLVGTLLHWTSLEVTLLGWRGILRFMVLYYVILYLRPTRQQILIAVGGLALLLFGESLLGLTQWLSGGRLDAFLAPSQQQFFGDITITIGTTLDWGEGQRVFGTLGKYEQLGSWLMMGLFFVIATLYEYQGPRKRWLWVLFAVGLVTLALTYSRAAWFGWVLGAVIMSFIIKRHKKVFFITLGALAALFLYKEFSGLVVDTLLARPYTNVGILERLFEVFSYERWRGEYFVFFRFYFLVEVPRKVIPLSPIFGFGPGQFGSGAAAALHNTAIYNLANIPFGIWGQVGFIDNNWLSLWAEVGTLGLLLYEI